MMKLTFTQHNNESGSITGKGINWWWNGRDAHGDMEAVEEITRSCTAALMEEWEEHLSKDMIDDLPYTAEVEWDGQNVENVTEVTPDFEFNAEVVSEPEEAIEEIQQYFKTAITLDEPLKVGENTVKIGDKTLTITVD